MVPVKLLYIFFYIVLHFYIVKKNLPSKNTKNPSILLTGYKNHVVKMYQILFIRLLRNNYLFISHS